jgi:hypothetical protein
LGAGEKTTVPLPEAIDCGTITPSIQQGLGTALERAGLTTEEAQAMLATWRESYFERDGLRVFWIVPRAFTDAVLPITITPQPAQLERVLIGRTEVLTPAFEARLNRDFMSGSGLPWMRDRYFFAYQARVRQLRVVLPAARP